MSMNGRISINPKRMFGVSIEGGIHRCCQQGEYMNTDNNNPSIPSNDIKRKAKYLVVMVYEYQIEFRKALYFRLGLGSARAWSFLSSFQA